MNNKNYKKKKKIQYKQYEHYKQQPYTVYMYTSACMHFYGVQLAEPFTGSSVLFWSKQTQLKSIFVFQHF